MKAKVYLYIHMYITFFFAFLLLNKRSADPNVILYKILPRVHV